MLYCCWDCARELIKPPTLFCWQKIGMDVGHLCEFQEDGQDQSYQSGPLVEVLWMFFCLSRFLQFSISLSHTNCRHTHRQMNEVIKIVITGKKSWQDLQGDLLRAIFRTLVEWNFWPQLHRSRMSIVEMREPSVVKNVLMNRLIHWGTCLPNFLAHVVSQGINRRK